MHPALLRLTVYPPWLTIRLLHPSSATTPQVFGCRSCHRNHKIQMFLKPAGDPFTGSRLPLCDWQLKYKKKKSNKKKQECIFFFSLLLPKLAWAASVELPLGECQFFHSEWNRAFKVNFVPTRLTLWRGLVMEQMLGEADERIRPRHSFFFLTLVCYHQTKRRTVKCVFVLWFLFWLFFPRLVKTALCQTGYLLSAHYFPQPLIIHLVNRWSHEMFTCS